MNRWNQLFAEISAAEAARLESERRRHHAAREAEELMAWSRLAAENYMRSLRELCQERAEELAIATGVLADISSVRTADLETPPGRARVISLALRNTQQEVVLYTYLTPGCLPVLHFLVSARGGRIDMQRKHRLVSFPGCRLTRGDHDRTVARPLGRAGLWTGSEELHVDDLVFRAFELLLRRELVPRPSVIAARSVRAGAITPLLGSPDWLPRI